MYAILLEEPASFVFGVGELFCPEDDGNRFSQNAGTSLPVCSMWHRITEVGTLKYYYENVRVYVFRTVLLELKVCYSNSCCVFFHYPVIF
jgi:hypothetical protein